MTIKHKITYSRQVYRSFNISFIGSFRIIVAINSKNKNNILINVITKLSDFSLSFVQNMKSQYMKNPLRLILVI